MKRININFIIIILIISFFNVSCASRIKMPQIKAEYYPQCIQPFNSLSQYQNKIHQRKIGYTAGGAVAGALVGGLTGLLSGDWKTAVAGGIAGGIGGAVAGYNIAKIEEIKDDNKRLYAYRDVMTNDLVDSSFVELSTLQSLKCYISEFETLQKDYSSQKITKQDYVKRYSEIKNALNELGKLSSNSRIMMAQRDIDMRGSIEKEYIKRGKIKNLASIDQVRLDRKNKQNTNYHKPYKVKKKSKNTNSIPEHSSSLELAQLKENLNKLSLEVESDKQKYTQLKESTDSKQRKNSTKSSTNTSAAAKPVSMDDVAVAYNDYTHKVVQMEDIDQQRRKALEIIDNEVRRNGIDAI